MEQQNQHPQPPVFNPQGQVHQPAPQYQPRVTASPMMDPVTAVKTCFRKYADFKGRARRSEFWWFALFVLVVSSALAFLGGLVPAISYVGSLFSLGTLIPLLCALTRRLHDTNRSGIWVAILAVFFLGYFVSFALLFGKNVDMLSNSADMWVMARQMTDIVQTSPGIAAVWSCSSLGVFIFFVIDHIFAAFDSKWGENKYGLSPKYQ